MVIADKNDPVWCKPADQLVGGDACGLFHIENGACGSDPVLYGRFRFAATRREEQKQKEQQSAYLVHAV